MADYFLPTPNRASVLGRTNTGFASAYPQPEQSPWKDYGTSVLSMVRELIAPEADSNVMDEINQEVSVLAKQGKYKDALSHRAEEMMATMFPYMMGAGIIAGPLAKTANPKALDLAKKMESAGASRDEIWKATGEQFGQPWMNDAKGGGWKFEIDDSGAALTDSATDAFHADMIPFPLSEYTSPLGDFMNHQGAYSAYPELKLAEVQRRGGDGGSYQHSPSPFVDRGYIEKIKLGVGEGENVKSVALHEGQHGVQQREGFARGGNVGEYKSGPMFDRRATDLNADLSQSLTGGISTRPNEVIDLIKYGDPTELGGIASKHGFKSIDEATEFLKHQDERRTPFGQYKRLAGEAESRNVQTRMDYPMQQRINEAPWTTLDVPEDELIYRMGGNGESMSDALSLPMDEASRMARAREMGFDGSGYHLTKNDVTEFSLNADPSSHSGGGAVWVRSDPAYSMSAHNTGKRGNVTEGANDMPLMFRGENQLKPADWSALKADGRLNQNFPQVVTMEENALLRDMGYTHATIGDETAIFDPKNIRSRFAAFDPAKKSSANILAGLGAAGLLTVPGMYDDR